MIKWLIKSTAEYRLETIEDVKKFEQEQRDFAKENDYTLSNFSYAEKEVKEKGEVVEIYYQVKVTMVFNTLKAPDKPFNGVEYIRSEIADLEWE